MTIYELEFDEAALKEWHGLDGSIRALFKKQLAKRLIAPHVPSAKLHGDLQNTYKIKLRDAGYRLVYEVIDQRLVVVVIAVGRRDHNAVYGQAVRRMKG
ncbi:MAG: type II toxin-antitoxin system RelE/ParE family toxin [Burkholderiales bacterium]|nr:type II toxin-antitoxin system RelE/ParE family toxin [Burkholderiales bacterium]MBK9348100.1 type II toxin-antitoxin system RelE/ParE family toxin [Burkholderiales bacterium]